MKEQVMKFLRDEDGLTAVEYAIAGALVAATLVAAFTTLGGNVENTIDCLSNAAAGTNGGCPS